MENLLKNLGYHILTVKLTKSWLFIERQYYRLDTEYKMKYYDSLDDIKTDTNMNGIVNLKASKPC